MTFRSEVTEADVLNQCMQWLRCKHIPAWRINTMGVWDKKKQAYRKAPSRGISDVIGVLPDGKILCVECKSKKGKLSVFQIDFLNTIAKNKGLAMVVYSVSDLQQILKKMGY